MQGQHVRAYGLRRQAAQLHRRRSRHPDLLLLKGARPSRDERGGNAKNILFLELPHSLQAFGMMGWRTGYIAYKDADGSFTRQLQKVQDTIPICPPQLSMHVALAASREGRPWVHHQLQSLLGNRSGCHFVL